jgi:hypothetical protein
MPTSLATPLSEAATRPQTLPRRRRMTILAIELLVIGVLPVLVALQVLGLMHWDLSIPLAYRGGDDVWQLVLTKMVRDNGWFLTNPLLGAPDIAHWNFHAAAQTSSLHSIIMLVMSWFIDDAVRIQQTYYLLNFALISLSAYATCRMLGLARFAAGTISYLFAFTSFRIGVAFYAFLTNYAAVPLVFVPLVWILLGQYASISAGRPTALFASRKFWLGLLFLVLVTLSDGYYAFFTLLLLAFATVLRLAMGDLRRPSALLAPVLYIATVMVLAVAMTIPLKNYQRAHYDEFFPGGKEDTTLIKHNYEAEVYSSSLKLMIAPLRTHRVPMLADLGKTMVESSDWARKIPVVQPLVSLGSICSLLLLAGLLAAPMLMMRNRNVSGQSAGRPDAYIKVAIAAGALAYFMFLASISGGVGTLVALIYPTIRGYDRFVLFLAFALLLGAGALISGFVQKGARRRLMAAYAAAIALTVIGIYDQLPGDYVAGNAVTARHFVAERALVHHIERVVPTGTMVYQYPHSQYLTSNPFYGWGSFAHMRLYLHSQKLRWSNGASKNSPVETWHDKTALMPFERLLREIEAVGFRAMVIDRTVVTAPQYQQIKAVLLARGLQVEEDAASELAWVRLPDPGYQVFYDAAYVNIDRLVVSDFGTFNSAALPRMVDGLAMRAAVAAQRGAAAATITRKAYPAAFVDPVQVDRGMGSAPVLPLTDMAGSLHCAAVPGEPNKAVVTVENRTVFDWQFGNGRLPFSLGVHVRGADDAMIRFDDGTRIAPGKWFVPAHGSVDVVVPLSPISRAGLPSDQAMRIEFAVVQDGHAWFDQLRCQVPMPAQH